MGLRKKTRDGLDGVRQPIVPIIVIMTLMSALLLGIAIYAGKSMNAASLEAQRSQIDNAISARLVRALHELKSVAWWDDAVINAAEPEKNREWLESEFGVYIIESYHHQRVALLDENDRPVFAYNGSGALDPRQAVTPIEGLGGLIREARGGVRKNRVRRDGNFRPPEGTEGQLGDWSMGNWSAALTLDNGKPALVSVMTITPWTKAELMPKTPRLMVSVIPIDEAFITEIAHVTMMPGLSFAKKGDDRSGSYTVNTDDGQPIAQLRWVAKQPGTVLLNTVVPVIIVTLLIAAGFMSVLLVRLVRSTRRLGEQEAEARYLANHDPMTGLPNRRRFQAVLAQRDIDSDSERVPVVACIDLDRFKDINDTLGHHAGDELIREVAARLSSLLREDDVLMRPGGDELAMLREARDRSDAEMIGAIVTACFSAPFSVAGQQIETSASVGLAIAEPGQSAQDLLRKADIALYVAKARGRACCAIFEEEMGQRVEDRRALEIDLRHALAEDALSLQYQPIVDAVTGRITGVEALARWHDPVRGNIPPDVFIGIAEEAGLMADLGRFVIDRAISDSRGWPNLDTAINVSPAQFRSVTMAAELAEAARRYGVDPSRITLEITESVLLANDERTLNTLKLLKQQGFRVALDDFGTGYSSLSYLRDFPFDKLKIDRSFVSGVTASGQSLSIIESVVSLGRGLGLEIVAEGVETETEMLVMQKAGCTHLQGYLFSRPTRLKEIEVLAAALGSRQAPETPARHPKAWQTTAVMTVPPETRRMQRSTRRPKP
jgi:diguanylate cyclase (GGDEF)-like protein